jgi:hypothetical protein
VNYVKDGGTFFYTPMKKKERRKALRKFQQFQLEYYPGKSILDKKKFSQSTLRRKDIKEFEAYKK